MSLLYVDHDVFTLFSEQNVPSAYTTVEELVLATSYLSDADIYTGRWEVLYFQLNDIDEL